MTDTTQDTTEENGTYIFFEPDNLLFENYSFRPEFVETMLRNYTYLNTGLAIIYNGQRILSRNGLVDLLNDNMTAVGLYPIIHLKGEDIEIAFTHTGQYGEEYYSFVNGQHTTQEVRIKVLSKSIWPVPSRNISTRIWTMPISVTDW